MASTTKCRLCYEPLSAHTPLLWNEHRRMAEGTKARRTDSLNRFLKLYPCLACHRKWSRRLISPTPDGRWICHDCRQTSPGA